MPKISVGICFKNPGRFLTFAVQSVFAQTYQDWELLLLDDASTDDSLEFARSLDDDRVRVLSDGHSRSLAMRLNEMVRMARGTYFARMDADDLMHPRRLQKQLDFLEQAPENTVLGTWAYSLSHDNEVLGIRKPANRQRDGFAARLSFIHPTVMAPVNWFRRNPYLEKPIAHWSEDAELWCRATGHSRFVTLQEPALFYREASTVSFEKSLGMYHASMNILQERYRNPRYRYLCSLTGEMFKLWSSGVLDSLGKGQLLIRKRYHRLDIAELEKANQIVREVTGTSLPARKRVLDGSKAESAIISTF